MSPLKWRFCLLVPWLFLLSFDALGQNDSSSVADVSVEAHHKLVLQNGKVRVFRVELTPAESTNPHRHAHPFAYVALTPATISNEVKGRTPVISELEFGELRTSKGGFILAERNAGKEPLTVVVIELLDNPNRDDGFTTRDAECKYHDAAVGHIFETNAWRGHEWVIASGGKLESHDEPYDHLVVALSPVHLKTTSDVGLGSLDVERGNVVWIPARRSVAIENVGKEPARYIEIEFR